MKLLHWSLMLIILFSLSSCNNYKKVYFAGEAQGTYYAVTYYDAQGRFFKTEIDSILYDFDQSVSLWVPGSLISRINDNDTSVRTDEVIEKLFELSVDVSEKTSGSFDFTIGPLVNAWGFGFKEGTDPDSLTVDSLKQVVDYKKVILENGFITKNHPDVSFDFNAIAQGYAVDLIGQFLESKGVENYLVDIGGEVLAKGNKPGNKPWIVGIEKPNDNVLDDRETQLKIHLKNKAVATSGNYRKYYVKDGVKYSHTIDPRTGYPVMHSLLSVTVVGDDAATADAYATAMMVMGLPAAKELAEKLKGIDALFISDEGEGKYVVECSEGFGEMIRE